MIADASYCSPHAVFFYCILEKVGEAISHTLAPQKNRSLLSRQRGTRAGRHCRFAAGLAFMSLQFSQLSSKICYPRVFEHNFVYHPGIRKREPMRLPDKACLFFLVVP